GSSARRQPHPWVGLQICGFFTAVHPIQSKVLLGFSTPTPPWAMIFPSGRLTSIRLPRPSIAGDMPTGSDHWAVASFVGLKSIVSLRWEATTLGAVFAQGSGGGGRLLSWRKILCPPARRMVACPSATIIAAE